MTKYERFVLWLNRFYHKQNKITICVLYTLIMAILGVLIYGAMQQRANSNVSVKYTVPYYTVTFDANGGKLSTTGGGVSSKQVKLGDTYGDLPVPTKSGKAFVGWTKNIVKDNIKQASYWSGDSTIIDKTTNKFVFSLYHSDNSDNRDTWRSFYIDVSRLAGKTLTISGKLAGLTENNATFIDLYIGQGNTGEYPYHITGSPDSKKVCDKASYSDGLYFSHTVTIIDNPSIIGLCLWGNVLSVGGKVELTVENLQVEVGSSASSFESSAQPLSPTTQKRKYTDETYVAMWDTNILDTTQTIGVKGWSGSANQLTSSNGYRYVFSVDGKSYDTEKRDSWASFYWDMSSYVGKIVTISGQLFNVSESGASFYLLSIGQGNTGDYPYHIYGSPDSKLVCDKSTYSRLLNFSHSVRIIDNPSIIGLCIWIDDIQNSSAEVGVTIYDLQIGVYG